MSITHLGLNSITPISFPVPEFTASKDIFLKDCVVEYEVGSVLDQAVPLY